MKARQLEPLLRLLKRYDVSSAQFGDVTINFAPVGAPLGAVAGGEDDETPPPEVGFDPRAAIREIHRKHREEKAQ